MCLKRLYGPQTTKRMLNKKQKWFTVYKVVRLDSYGGKFFRAQYQVFTYKKGLNAHGRGRKVTINALSKERYFPAFHAFLTRKAAVSWKKCRGAKIVHCKVPKSAITAYGPQAWANINSPTVVCSYIVMPQYPDTVVRPDVLRKAKKEYAKLVSTSLSKGK